MVDESRSAPKMVVLRHLPHSEGRRSRVIVLYFPFRQTSPYFTSLRTKDGDAILNLEYGNASIQWGRLIFHVSDVDRFWAYPMEKGFYPDSPRDASWGERYFHMPDRWA